MTLDFITNPLSPVPRVDPLCGQLVFPFPTDQEPDDMVATKAKPTTKKSAKVKPAKMEPPRSPSDPDTVQMLRAAIVVKDGARDRWIKLVDAAEGASGPTNVEILDQLAEEWYEEPDSGNDLPTESRWRAQGGALPSIWFGQSNAIGTVIEPHLKGFALADAVRPLINQLAEERPPRPPVQVPAIEQPPNGRLLIDKIKVVANPRKTFDEDQLNELAESIRARGIIQALTVSPADSEGMHTLIAGERRLRAARKLELTEVPVYVRNFEAGDEAVDRLLENVARVDLTAIEEAEGYQQLLEGGLSQRELARQLGKSQGHIGNRVRLLKLPATIQAEIISGNIGQAEGRTLASWTDRPAVINEFADFWADREDFQRDFTKCLALAVLNASRAMDKGHDGPRFKVTPEIAAELDIVPVKIGNVDMQRAFYTPLWDKLQKEAEEALAAKKAAKAKPAAKPDEREPEAPTEPVKRGLTEWAIANMWNGWFMRALVKRFSTKKLKPADEAHLNRLAIILLEPYPHLLDEMGLSDKSDQQAADAIAQQTVEGLLDSLRVALIRELIEEPMNFFASTAQARALCESVGISLRTWTPDAQFLTAVPDHLLLDWANEYDMKPSKNHDKLVDQLVDCWTIGWIPEPLNIFPAAD